MKNGDDAAKLAEDLRDAIQNKQWMCGFPDKLVVFTYDRYVVALYGITPVAVTVWGTG